MEIEKKVEKKEYEAPQMTVVDMACTSLLCGSTMECEGENCEID